MHYRSLNWTPQFDERSREYGISAVSRPAPRRDKQWKIGPILDQGREGACVGFGWTAEALATPTPVDLSRTPWGVPRDPTKLALEVYKQAQLIDEFPGEEYGTSVLAGAKIMKKMGFLKEYRWAFSVDDVITGLINRGPVVLGIEWRSGMYAPKDGVLKLSGDVVGGHCITAVGFRSVKSSAIPGQESVVLQNSWGLDWGVNGLAQISVSDLTALLAAQGEACVPYKRSYGRG